MIDRLDWGDISLLLAVSRARSFNEAAGVIGITQSTVSRRIGALEKLAGVPLFKRLPTGILLTGAGQRLVEEARAVEAAVGKFKTALEEVKAQGNRPVRVMASEGAGTYLLTPILARQAMGPAVTVHSRLQSLNFPKVRVVSDRAAEVEPDIRLVWTAPDKLPAMPGTARVRLLLDVEFMPFCGRAYAGPDRRLPANFKQMAEYDLLHVSVYDQFEAETALAPWNRLVADARRPGLTVDWTSAVERPLIAGSGITLLPKYSITYSDQLLPVTVPAPPMALKLWQVADVEALNRPEVRETYDSIFNAFRWIGRELASTGFEQMFRRP